MEAPVFYAVCVGPFLHIDRQEFTRILEPAGWNTVIINDFGFSTTDIYNNLFLIVTQLCNEYQVVQFLVFVIVTLSLDISTIGHGKIQLDSFPYYYHWYCLIFWNLSLLYRQTQRLHRPMEGRCGTNFQSPVLHTRTAAQSITLSDLYFCVVSCI